MMLNRASLKNLILADLDAIAEEVRSDTNDDIPVVVLQAVNTRMERSLRDITRGAVRYYDGAVARKESVFNFLQAYINERGYAPTMREIRDAVNLASTSTVRHHLLELVEDGWIEMTPGVGRSIRITRVEGDDDQ